jgi:ABC-type bacteriocin/lantibiotic exporter with double-glycine peptidase domain
MKTRRGGQPVKLPSKIKFTENIHDKDCGASVLKFLSYATPEVSDHLAHLTPEGIHGDKILQLLDLAYGKKGFRWDKVDGPDDLQLLKVKEATIASYGTKENGHYFVIYRTSKDVYFAIDPQAQTMDTITSYLDTKKKRDTFFICLIDDDQDSIEYGDSKITIEMVERLFK